jgi:hypothetical protein
MASRKRTADDLDADALDVAQPSRSKPYSYEHELYFYDNYEKIMAAQQAERADLDRQWALLNVCVALCLTAACVLQRVPE